MAFENLSDRLQMAMRRVTGKGRLTEQDINDMMREVRLSLLEADVNYKVVREFTKDVKEKALGEKILKGLNPGQQVVKIVHDELQQVMGDKAEPIGMNMVGITKVMLVGLQGAGKTTTAGKLALFLRKQHNVKPLLVALDIYRPAAVEQLKTLAGQLNVDIYEQGTTKKPEIIIQEAMDYAVSNGNNLVIADTAGRLHIDDSMMDELVRVKSIMKPDEVLLTLDAMTGQDAVNVTEHFHSTLQVTGAILTKLDGDTRGGAALSLRRITNVPIKLMGMGEKLDQLEVFHPERMASRILGMGDVMTLVDKVTENIDEDDMMGMMEKMMSGKFNYNDYIKQLKMIKRMGSLGGILKLIPGMGKALKGQDIDEKQLVYIEAMISSMTKEERKNPKLIARSSSRRRRIASGSGRRVSDVNRLIQTMDQQAQMMKRMGSMNPAQMNPANPLSAMQQPSRQKKKGKGKNKRRYPF
ncbi:signal recognition particle protein [Candidatus Xianfuyuplasma coldseepsis]|uniref:Signal recognition particle protein n=1 Tax=Candidatus Xianfuyuplasma coldseepsis TaxID=2782163 RepID=A0A7L7KS30_9MOLU|nr:signal recognition particle protein [Xianfuyuplasma coldseepsis]QMS85405.1 signal recognition particle protein [Xianfuyuplasma coldseepsis]